MITIDYAYYKDEYGGSNTEDAFNKELRKATKLVSNRTNGKINNISDDDTNTDLVTDIKNCICNVIDKCFTYESSDGKVVSSQSAGKLSESYVIDSSKKSFENDIAGVVKLWLSEYGYTNLVWI